jgi:hypothetical protein
MQIKIRLAQSLITLHVHPHDQVNVIRGHLPNLDSRCVFLFNQSVISHAFTFAFYGIHEGSEILVLETGKPQTPAFPTKLSYLPTLCQLRQRSIELARVFGQESPQRAFEEFLDPSLGFETARIRDQYFSRIEGTYFSHRRHLFEFGKFDHSDTKREKVCQTKCEEGSKPVSPSDEELPACWTKRRGKFFKS